MLKTHFNLYSCKVGVIELANLDCYDRDSNGRILLTCNGETKTILEWSRSLGVPRNTIYSRLKRGWSTPDALFGKER